MTEFLYLLLGLLVGGLAGVYWANTRARSALTGRVAEFKKQVVRSSHQLREEVDQLRERLESKDRELEGIKATMDQERHGTTTTHARFQHLQDQNKQLERATVELKERTAALGAELLGFARGSLTDLARFQESGKSLESLLETYRETIESVESRLRAVPERLAELGVSPEDEAPAADAPARTATAPPPPRVLSGRDPRGPTRPA